MQATNVSDYFTSRAASANPERPAAPETRRELWLRVFRSYAITQSSDYAIRSALADFPPERIDRFVAEEIARDAVDAVRATIAGFSRTIATKAEDFLEVSEDRFNSES